MHENEPEIDRSIYPMPMFANVVVRDLAAAQEFYHAVGFISLATIPGPGGVTQVVHLRRMRYQDILLTVGEPTPGSSIGFQAGDVDLAEIAGRLRAGGWDTAKVEGPFDTRWFTTDLAIDDPDGNRIVITAQRVADQEQAKEWARTFEGEWRTETPGPGVPEG